MTQIEDVSLKDLFARTDKIMSSPLYADAITLDLVEVGGNNGF